MGHEWDAQVEVGPELAARLIERQFPELAPARLELLGVGWDNTAYTVNGRWVFRFPRRPIAVGLLANEARALPLLAPRLPLPVPVPEFIGVPAEGYPWPFAGYGLLPGRPAHEADLSDEARARCAEPLGRFLAALHAVPVDAEARAWAPGDELRRADLAYRLPQLRERLRSIGGLVNLDLGAVAALAERLAGAAPWTGEVRWVHGDLYARHLLVDGGGRLTGVIDWGDVHLGDVALDLSVAFSFLAPSARDAFRAAYGTVDDEAWERARFRALHYGAILVAYGADIGDAAVRAAGEYALREGAR